MTFSHTPDASAERYFESLNAVAQELVEAAASTANAQLALVAWDALTEVLEWNNQGQAADETACQWLALLRWYADSGHVLPETAPYSLARKLSSFGVWSTRGIDPQVLESLALGSMQLVDKNSNPIGHGSGALLRAVPFGFLPVEDENTIISLCVRATALTHGSSEAFASSIALALMVRELLGAKSPQAQPIAAAYENLCQWVADLENQPLVPGLAPLTAQALTELTVRPEKNICWNDLAAGIRLALTIEESAAAVAPQKVTQPVESAQLTPTAKTIKNLLLALANPANNTRKDSELSRHLLGQWKKQLGYSVNLPS